MAVYVDDMTADHRPAHAPARRYVMCHMIADSEAELHAMADAIGAARKWHQAPPRHDSHYDIRRMTGELGTPEHAECWCREFLHARKFAQGASSE